MTIYPKGPEERIVLSDAGERFARACTSKQTKFRWLAIDLCASRRPIPKGEELPTIRSEADIAEIVGKLLPNLTSAIQESFGVVCLNARNQVVGFSVPFTGGVAYAPVDLTVMLKVPLLVPTCTSLIVFHNHPSGDPDPSTDDIVLTEKLEAAAKTVGLRLLDHVVIGSRGTYSFRDHGRLR